MTKFRVKASALRVRSGPGTQYKILGLRPDGFVVDEVDGTGWCPVNYGTTVGWMSRAYLAEVTDQIPAGDPPWVAWAISKVGIQEVAGAADNPEIVSWFKYTTLPKDTWHDATAWCAVFVNAALFINGAEGDRSALAVDFLKWGVKAPSPAKGDVAVFDWGLIGQSGHHVAFYLNDMGERIQVVGGNQSDAVTITTYSKTAVMGYRRAVA